MGKWKWKMPILALSFMLSVVTARAAVLFDQTAHSNPASAPSSSYSFWMGGFDMDIPYTVDHRQADDFTLLTNATITELAIRGTFHEDWNNGGVLNGFNVFLYANNAGAPGALLQNVNGVNLTPTVDGLNQLYQIDLSANPLSVSANTTYWIAVQAALADQHEGSDFYWNFANDGGYPPAYTPNGSAAVVMNDGTLGNSWGRHYEVDPFGDGSWVAETFSGSLPSGWQAMDLSFSLIGTGGEVQIAGDANGDGVVNLADLSSLINHYGMTSGATWANGDFNSDGKVDLADLSTIINHYGGTSGLDAQGQQALAAAGLGGVSPVPEPSSLVLLVAALLGLGGYCLRRR